MTHEAQSPVPPEMLKPIAFYGAVMAFAPTSTFERALGVGTGENDPDEFSYDVSPKNPLYPGITNTREGVVQTPLALIGAADEVFTVIDCSIPVGNSKLHSAQVLTLMDRDGGPAKHITTLGSESQPVGRNIQKAELGSSRRVSRQHFAVSTQNGRFSVEDLGSGNNTRVLVARAEMPVDGSPFKAHDKWRLPTLEMKDILMADYEDQQKRLGKGAIDGAVDGKLTN